MRKIVLTLTLFCIWNTYAQTIKVQPYPQDVTTSSAYILWETNNFTESKARSLVPKSRLLRKNSLSFASAGLLNSSMFESITAACRIKLGVMGFLYILDVVCSILMCCLFGF
jgi:hypothetical protein